MCQQLLVSNSRSGLDPTVWAFEGREFLSDTREMLNFSYTGWRTKCNTIDCARNTFLLLQKHLTSGTELILIGWKIVPNEEHVQ